MRNISKKRITLGTKQYVPMFEQFLNESEEMEDEEMEMEEPRGGEDEEMEEDGMEGSESGEGSDDESEEEEKQQEDEVEERIQEAFKKGFQKGLKKKLSKINENLSSNFLTTLSGYLVTMTKSVGGTIFTGTGTGAVTDLSKNPTQLLDESKHSVTFKFSSPKVKEKLNFELDGSMQNDVYGAEKVSMLKCKIDGVPGETTILGYYSLLKTGSATASEQTTDEFNKFWETNWPKA